MKKLIFFYLLFFCITQAQSIDLKSPQNIKLFADFLFCEKDYLRAIEEYEKHPDVFSSDTVKFKIALAYQKMEKLPQAKRKFEDLLKSSVSKQSEIEFYKTIFLSNNYDQIHADIKNNSSPEIKKLYLFSYFFMDDPLPEMRKYSEAFSSDKVFEFYEWKNDLPYKSTAAAALFSAVIPGLGKIYTDNIGDGITAFLATGVLAYLSYTNFKHDHKFKGWLFGGLGALFYAGNIYGSAASAKIYNARISFNFENEVKLFLEQNNYFSPDYNFCK